MRSPGPILLFLSFLLAMSTAVRAETAPAPGGAQAPGTPPFRPTVREVRVDASDPRMAVLGDTLLVTLGQGELDQLLRSKKDFWLYLNGTQLEALPVSFEPSRDLLRYELRRNADNKIAWNRLLSGWRDRKVSVGVGQEPGPGSGDATFVLHLFPTGRTAVALVLAVLSVCGMLVLGVRTNMLRDPTPTGVDASALPRRSFSLGRTQMAWWTEMIVLALLAMWAITGSIEIISGSMLALMGIGAGTFASSVFLSDSQGAVRPSYASEGLLRDLLTEAEGISLHRFQMVLWTLIVTVAFWMSVVRDLVMPELDPVLLGLLGVSNGTYLGFKFR